MKIVTLPKIKLEFDEVVPKDAVSPNTGAKSGEYWTYYILLKYNKFWIIRYLFLFLNVLPNLTLVLIFPSKFVTFKVKFIIPDNL